MIGKGKLLLKYFSFSGEGRRVEKIFCKAPEAFGTLVREKEELLQITWGPEC